MYAAVHLSGGPQPQASALTTATACASYRARSPPTDGLSAQDRSPVDRHVHHGWRSRVVSEDSSVTVDIVSRLVGDPSFFYLDTDVLFAETYATRDALAARYGIEFQRFSGISLEEQAQLYGDSLWARQPDACCGIRKVEPMREALIGFDCWVSGIRREDSQTRAGAAKFGWDKRFGWKLTRGDWTERRRVHSMITRSVNPLHDDGYASIGCTHCTRPAGAGGDSRSGRWADAHKTECGLHG